MYMPLLFLHEKKKTKSWTEDHPRLLKFSLSGQDVGREDKQFEKSDSTWSHHVRQKGLKRYLDIMLLFFKNLFSSRDNTGWRVSVVEFSERRRLLQWHALIHLSVSMLFSLCCFSSLNYLFVSMLRSLGIKKILWSEEAHQRRPQGSAKGEPVRGSLPSSFDDLEVEVAVICTRRFNVRSSIERKAKLQTLTWSTLSLLAFSTIDFQMDDSLPWYSWPSRIFRRYSLNGDWLRRVRS